MTKKEPKVLAEVSLGGGIDPADAPEKHFRFLGLEFAPLTISWERRLQTLGVAMFFFLFLLFSVFCAVIMIYVFFYTRFWWLSALYATFIYYDREIGESGGRRPWTCFIRRWSLWRHFCRYFPVRLVKTTELDPKKSYLLGYHPHGVLCFGAFAAFATDALKVRELFNGLFPRLMILNQNFLYPGVRELAAWSGICSATRRGMEAVMSEDKGVAAVLVPSGASEALNFSRDEVRLVLKRRKGFIRMALRFGRDLVPVFAFGEGFLYDHYANPEGSRLYRFQKWFQRRYSFTLPAFHGRGIFQYTWGLIPYRKPVNVVVGAPVAVDKVEEPTDEQIEQLQLRYIEALTDLYETYNPKYGDVNVKLVIT